MKAQINRVNEGSVVVSLYNSARIVNQRWFDSIKKAENFCNKYKYEVCQMSNNIDTSIIYSI